VKENKETEGGKNKETEQNPLSSEETVGEILFSARTNAGRTKLQISEVTRMSEEILQYLETDNFDMLPARVYVRGFLRNYATELGLDVEHLLEKYEVQTGQTHKSKGDFWEVKEKTIEEKRSPVNISKNHILMAIGVIAVIIIVVLILRNGNDPDVSILRGIPDVKEIIDKENEKSQHSAELNSPEDSIETINSEKPKISSFNTQVKKQYNQPLKLSIIANPTDTAWFNIITISSTDGKPDTSYYDFILHPGEIKTLTAGDAFIFKTIGNAGGFGIEFREKKFSSIGGRNEVLKNIYFSRDSIYLGNN